MYDVCSYVRTAVAIPMDVTADTREPPPPLAPLAITTVQGIPVVGATSVIVARRRSVAQSTASTQNFGQRLKHHKATGRPKSIESIKNDEHTDSNIREPAPKKMMKCRNCSCGAADHSGIVETDTFKTRNGNTMNQWAEGLKVVLPDHLPVMYVHFSHFSVEDCRSSVNNSVYLRRNAEPSLQSRSIFATKEDLKAYLQSVPVHGAGSRQNSIPPLCTDP